MVLKVSQTLYRLSVTKITAIGNGEMPINETKYKYIESICYSLAKHWFVVGAHETRAKRCYSLLLQKGQNPLTKNMLERNYWLTYGPLFLLPG